MHSKTPAGIPELEVSVRELSRQPGNSRRMELSFPAPADLGTDVISIPEGDQVDLDLLLEAVHEGVLVTGTVRSEARGECVRCLDPVAYPVDVTFQELHVYPERAEAAQESGDDASEEPQVVDDVVSLEGAVRDAIVLALPFQPLCEDGCLGLCPECGLNLNEHPEHDHRSVDPRWAVLEDLLEDRREES
jgi:uncharacterized protein